MKTSASNGNPPITITVAAGEAIELWMALLCYEKTHRKSPRPPQIQPLLAVLKASMREQQPEMFENFFGCKRNDPARTVWEKELTPT